MVRRGRLALRYEHKRASDVPESGADKLIRVEGKTLQYISALTINPNPTKTGPAGSADATKIWDHVGAEVLSRHALNDEVPGPHEAYKAKGFVPALYNRF
jgi:hypothetical protein